MTRKDTDLALQRQTDGKGRHVRMSIAHPPRETRIALLIDADHPSTNKINLILAKLGEDATQSNAKSASTDAGDAQACAFLELVSAAGGLERFGVGMDTLIVKALLSVVNRLGLMGLTELAVVESEVA